MSQTHDISTYGIANIGSAADTRDSTYEINNKTANGGYYSVGYDDVNKLAGMKKRYSAIYKKLTDVYDEFYECKREEKRLMLKMQRTRNRDASSFESEKVDRAAKRRRVEAHYNRISAGPTGNDGHRPGHSLSFPRAMLSLAQTSRLALPRGIGANPHNNKQSSLGAILASWPSHKQMSLPLHALPSAEHLRVLPVSKSEPLDSTYSLARAYVHAQTNVQALARACVINDARRVRPSGNGSSLDLSTLSPEYLRARARATTADAALSSRRSAHGRHNTYSAHMMNHTPTPPAVHALARSHSAMQMMGQTALHRAGSGTPTNAIHNYAGGSVHSGVARQKNLPKAWAERGHVSSHARATISARSASSYNNSRSRDSDAICAVINATNNTNANVKGVGDLDINQISSISRLWSSINSTTSNSADANAFVKSRTHLAEFEIGGATKPIPTSRSVSNPEGYRRNAQAQTPVLSSRQFSYSLSTPSNSKSILQPVPVCTDADARVHLHHQRVPRLPATPSSIGSPLTHHDMLASEM